MSASDRPVISFEVAEQLKQFAGNLDPLYKALPPAEQKLQLWAQAQLPMYDAENSQREWSSETFGLWLAKAQAGTLGSIPVMVLTRAEGGYREGATDIPAAQLETERKQGQAMLASLSTNSKQIFIMGGHNMELDSPQSVVAAIEQMIGALRSDHKL
jgi:hypothetical protein